MHHVEAVGNGDGCVDPARVPDGPEVAEEEVGPEGEPHADDLGLREPPCDVLHDLLEVVRVGVQGNGLPERDVHLIDGLRGD